MAEWGIEGWDPEWFGAAEDLLDARFDLLRSLCGQRLREAWIAWSVDDDEWWSDAPVLFDFRGERLAICTQQLDLLSVEAVSVDTARPFRWCARMDEADDEDAEIMEWRASPTPELRHVRDAELRAMALLESRVQDPFRAPRERWCLSGLRLDFAGSRGLVVRNGLDENVIAASVTLGEDLRVVSGGRAGKLAP